MPQSIIDKANAVLKHMALQAEGPWDEIVLSNMNDTEGVAFKAKIQKLALKTPGSHIFGTYVGSSSSMRPYFPDYLPSEWSEVFSILKEHNKIVQGGRGKGICFVIFNSLPLPHTLEPEVLDLGTMAKRLSSYDEDFEYMREQLETARKTLVEQEQKIHTLQSEVNIRYLTSWS